MGRWMNGCMYTWYDGWIRDTGKDGRRKGGWELGEYRDDQTDNEELDGQNR